MSTWRKVFLGLAVIVALLVPVGVVYAATDSGGGSGGHPTAGMMNKDRGGMQAEMQGRQHDRQHDQQHDQQHDRQHDRQHSQMHDQMGNQKGGGMNGTSGGMQQNGSTNS
jgi:hypothetical protein